MSRIRTADPISHWPGPYEALRRDFVGAADAEWVSEQDTDARCRRGITEAELQNLLAQLPAIQIGTVVSVPSPVAARERFVARLGRSSREHAPSPSGR